jgi:uncharacterized protein (TIGR02145 family)
LQVKNSYFYTIIYSSKKIIMKTFSLIIAMMFCIVLLQAQTHEIASPAKDSARSMETQTISLSQGWTGISSYLDPADPDVALLMEAIQEQLVILMDIDGNYYQPSGKSPLINWDFTKGYYIKLASEETLEITGLYPLNKQLDLQTGWNLIPVLSDVSVDIEDYFADHLGNIEIVNEVAGLHIYWPAMSIYTLTQLMPGKAYFVKATAPFSLFELPEVATAPVTDITAFNAVSGGEVISEGSSPVTVRGVVWSTLENPTVEDNEGITLDGPGAGTFVSEVTGLLSETTYFLRAYATNDEGTAYGNEIEFTTPFGTSFECFTVTDVNGNLYNAELIGDQCWMAENLKATKTAGGGDITRYCYQNDPDWCDIYGGLYKWETIMNGAAGSNEVPSGVQGICPTGWHVPSAAEWQILVDYLGGALVAGGKMKSTRTEPQDHPRWNLPNIGATNESGFNALPGGYRYFNNSYYHIGNTTYFFTTTEYFNFSYKRSLSAGSASIPESAENRGTATAVRCIKD